jgi:hypothetical protein
MQGVMVFLHGRPEGEPMKSPATTPDGIQRPAISKLSSLLKKIGRDEKLNDIAEKFYLVF